MQMRCPQTLALVRLTSITRWASFVLLVLVTVLSPAQTFTTLLQFNGANGGTPLSPLIQDFDGNLSATSEFAGSHGGANFGGTAYKTSTAGTLTTLYNFCVGGSGNCTDGYNPVAGLAQDASGMFYGTATAGGTHGPFAAYGTVFKLTSSGVLTTLHSFCALGGCADGTNPNGGVILASNGSLYGTTVSGGTKGSGTVFKMTTSGTLTTLHDFCSLTNCSDGAQPSAGLVQASDGNFYGSTNAGGTNSEGTVFKITASGTLSTLYAFCSQSSCMDGAKPYAKFLQAADGNLYGTTTSGGKFNQGTVFKITTAGKLTTLYSFCKLAACADGKTPLGTLIQATDGNFYGTTFLGGANGFGTIFELKPTGTLTTLYSFCPTSGCPDGANPIAGLVQDTNGEFYGSAMDGGSTAFNCDGAGNGGTAPGCGTVFSLSVGLHPFLSLLSTSGKVGSKVGILGQGFDSTSVVKFNGATATTRTVTGTTYITATVPAGAIDGYVTVTIGATTLTSSQQFTVHNSWSIGKAMPTSRFGAFTGAIGTNIYVVGGATNSGYQVTNVNEIYNTLTNTWKTGAPDPTSRELGASAVVNGILYVIGGSTSGSNPLSLVEAYNPVSNTWTTKAPMPTARNSMPAVVDKNVIYVIGGYDPNTQFFYDTVESYNTTTDTWTEEKPLPVGTAWEAVGLLGTTIVAADGQVSPGTVVGSSEGYNPSTNTWTGLTADPTPRLEACFAAISGQLYVAGGANATGVLNVNEAYNATTKKWTTLASLPNALATAGSATVGGLLYCFGGANDNLSSVYNYVQIYQP